MEVRVSNPMEKQEVFEIIDEYMKSRQPFQVISQVQEFDLRERVIRVEEGIKRVQEQISNILVMMEKRFEQVEKRFELMEKRFDQIDKRFEQVDKRFEQVDKRFEDMQNYMDRRFDEQQGAINRLSSRMFQFMIWSFGFTVTAAGVVIAVLK